MYKIGLIGSGNVASHFAHLMKSKVEIQWIYSRTYESAAILANEVDSIAIGDLNNLPEVDFVLIATSDNAIITLVDKLKKSDAIVVHTSGSTHITVLEQCKAFGVMYPLQTFKKGQEINAKNFPIFIEGSSRDVLDKIRDLASVLSSQVHELNSQKRKELHISAVFACNFSNHMMHIAEQLCVKNAIDFELLRPLILETFHKVKSNLPSQLQTGPAVREDMSTINRHLEALSSEPDLQELYRKIGRNIQKINKLHT